MCSLSWREPKSAQRPITATVSGPGPFKVLSRPLTLRPVDAKAPAPGSPARGPVAWWKLDEASGSQAADASGRNHPAQILGVARWAPGQGPAGGAVELDGAKNLLDGGDNGDFDFRDGVTVTMWVKPRGKREASQSLATKGSDTWNLELRKDGTLVFLVNGPITTGKDRRKAPAATSKGPLDGTSWHHVVGVYDGQRIALYVDGELQNSVLASGQVTVNTEPLWVGNNAAVRGQAFGGWLDDVRLYACGLNESEIKALQRAGGK